MRTGTRGTLVAVGGLCLGLLCLNVGAYGQEVEPAPAAEDIIAQIQEIRDQLQNNPATEELRLQVEALRAQMREDRWNADLIVQLDLLSKQIRDQADPALVEQMQELREQLRATMEAGGGRFGGMRGPRFVDTDGDGINDPIQRGGGMGSFGGFRPGGIERIYTDTDGDGVIDQVLVDNDGDGVGDISLQEHLEARWQEMDQDGDGVPDRPQGRENRGRRGRRPLGN